MMVRRPERYAASGSQTIIEVNPCLTTLLYPFVTNQHMFDTGLVITNASVESGSCTINYSGANAPDDMTSQPIAGGAQWIALASNIAQGIPGLYHCNLRISGCARLCLSHRRLW